MVVSPQMLRAFSLCLVQAIAVLCLLAAAAHGQRPLSLPVDLTRLDGQQFLTLLSALQLESPDGFQSPLVDLRTLSRLHAHLLQIHVNGPTEEAAKRAAQQDLSRVLRKVFFAAELKALRPIVLGDGKEIYGDYYLFDAYCHRWIVREIAQILQEPRRNLDFPADPPPLPEPFGAWTSEKFDHTEFRRAAGPFAKLLRQLASQPSRGLHEDGDRFEQLTQDFLFERRKKVAQELLNFTWDSWCGTGAFEFEQRKMLLVFMGLLRERRIAEAAGVSFFVPSQPEWTREPGRPIDQWRIDLLKFCGIDWEAALLGAGRLEALAAAGSERALRHGLAVMAAPGEPHEKSPWSLEELTRFLVPRDSGDDAKADPRTAITVELQAEVLKLLDVAAQEDVPFHQLDQTVRILEDLRRRETVGTLRRLLKHPSTTYQQRAATILQQFGDAIEPIKPAPPVRFRIYRNEQPWRSAEISYGIPDARISHSASGYLKTDAEGFGTIPRDEFLDPAKRGTRLVFSHYPRSDTVWGKSVYESPWVSTEIPTPNAFDETFNVRLTTCPLPVEISYGSPPPPGTVASTGMRLRKAGDKGSESGEFFLYFSDDRVEVPKALTFGHIQPGQYQLWILAPGSAAHTTEPFEVKPGMSPVKVQLEKGSDVYTTLVIPESARSGGEMRLFRDGQDITGKTERRFWGPSPHPRFSGLPRGSYQLRVLSTEEYMREHQITEWKAPDAKWQPDLRDGVDCEGLTVEFTIDDATPALLDLGELRVQPVPAMRAKAEPPTRRGGPAPAR